MCSVAIKLESTNNLGCAVSAAASFVPLPLEFAFERQTGTIARDSSSLNGPVLEFLIISRLVLHSHLILHVTIRYPQETNRIAQSSPHTALSLFFSFQLSRSKYFFLNSPSFVLGRPHASSEEKKKTCAENGRTAQRRALASGANWTLASQPGGRQGQDAAN